MLTNVKINSIRTKIQRALRRIERAENVEIQFSPLKRSSSYAECTSKLVLKEVLSASQKDAENERLSKQIGFTQNVIGMKFSTSKSNYEIVEIRIRNHRYPVIVKRGNGRLYKYPVSSIRSMIGGDKIINRNANLENIFK